MAKTLQFEFDGIEYTLEFTKRTVDEMERKGFIVSELTDKPMSRLPELFRGAFLAHHRFTKTDVIDKIYDSLDDKTELIGKLAEMYNEPIMSLVDDSGNVSWTANF